MARSILKILMGTIVVAAVAGCGNPDNRGSETTFVTNGPENSGDGSPATEPVPFFMQKEERQEALPEFSVPENIRTRINQEIPDFAPIPSTKFRVINHNLKINVATSTMTFTGVLQIPGKADESIELSCKFDKTKTWTCADMFPTKPEVARERRLQATVNCLDTYNCDQVGLELFVLIEGRTESQLFQSGQFEVRRASSGDVDEGGKLGTPPPQSTQQKPTPEIGPLNPIHPQRPKRTRPPAPPVTDEELKGLLENPNAAVEVTTPMPVPAPIRGEFSIPDIERLRPEVGAGVPNQAIGTHNRGRLNEGAKLPANGPGFIGRPGRAAKSFGTNLMIDVLKLVSQQVATAVPNKSPFVISNISKQNGGRLCNGRSCHASHQTGLDVDVAFPSHKFVNDLWSACNSTGRSDCQNPISRDFDAQRFWLFAKQATCAENNPVIAMFVDTEIKKYMCNWAKNQAGENINDPNSCAFKTLRAMKYEPGHHNHFHMRLRCPGNRDCRNATVSLGRGTGC